MQKKRLSTKVLSAVLSLLMILTVIPLVPLAPTADAATTEYYYPAGTKFIKDIAMVYYKDSGDGQNNIKNSVGYNNGNGALLCYDDNGELADLTVSTGGTHYVYIGWTWTTKPEEAIRGFRVSNVGEKGSNGFYSIPSSYEQSGVKWYQANSGNPANIVPKLHSDGNVNLNHGTIGEKTPIRLFVTKDASFGPPLTNLVISRGPADNEDEAEAARDKYLNKEGWNSVVSFQDNDTIMNLNRNTGKNTTRLYMHYYSPCVQLNTTNLRNAYTSTATYLTTSGYTPESTGDLAKARGDAYSIISELNKYGVTTKSQANIDATTNSITNAVNNLTTTLTLNASANGGSPDRTINVKIGGNSTVSINLNSYTPSRQGLDFLGWAKKATDKEGTKGNVTVGLGETLYALFGKELEANFHYLLPDGSVTKETRRVNALNGATNAVFVLSSELKDITTAEGKTLTSLGWRTDTKAEAPTFGKNELYTVYIDNPVVNFYAVYSAPITFTQDVNKGSPVIDPTVETQYINVNTEIVKTSHTFTVTNIEPERAGGVFKGWADDIEATESKYVAGYTFTTTEDKTIYAIYDLAYYTVEFVDGDGNTLAIQEIKAGEPATAPDSTPVKSFDDDYHYTFAGWDKDFSEVMSDITVTATFTPVSHNYEKVTLEAVDCLVDGKERWTCNCGFTKDVTVEHQGHSPVVIPGTPATCSTKGSTDSETCSKCLEVLKESKEIDALGHKYVKALGVSATCTTGGYEIWVCENNRNHQETRNVTAPTGEHVEKAVKAEAADCLTNGLTEGCECAMCGSVITAQNVILAEGHKLVTGEDEKYIAPTCEEKGRTQGKHCSVCNLVIVETEEIPALGHDWADFVAKPATCTEAGYTAGSKCRRCHDVKDSTEIPALNHGENGYTVIVHEATCTEDGYTEYICDYDTKHNYKENGEAATGHEGGTATCKDKAICTKCGEAYGNTIAHSYDSVVFPATCTKKGYTEFTCTVCGDSYQGDETPLAAHKYDDGKITTAPTCCDAGVKTFTCINCSEASYTEAVAATGHTVTDWTVEGTEATGSCDDCGETITANPEDVGLELPECERCGMVHKYNSGLFKYKGIYCSIIYFFRQIANFFKGNA